ncbi:hypothetical protein R1sor_023536 [Riccia sorocarpa]|uniref:Uncharacterized protein n=1 Tax=Riccia sorocarpa TaxID=122646 RepID=A0ABD3GMX6_9MARC
MSRPLDTSEFIQVASKNKHGGKKTGEGIDRSLRGGNDGGGSNARKWRRGRQRETPLSPCEPCNVSPKAKETLDQLGNTEALETDPEPTPAERTDVGNLTLEQLMAALKQSKEKTLQELKKSGTRSGKDELRQLLASKDGDHEQNPVKTAEETREPSPLAPGVRWAEVESGNEDEVERLNEEPAESENVSEADNEKEVVAVVEVGSASTEDGESTHTAAEGSREVMETEETIEDPTDTLAPNSEQVAERARRPLAEAKESTSERQHYKEKPAYLSDPETEGEQELSGMPVIFAASKNPRRQLTVGDSQRKTGSWRRSGARFNSGRDCPPNVEEDFSEEDGSSEGELNLMEEGLPDEPLGSLPGGSRKNKSKPPHIPEKVGDLEAKGLTRPAEFSDSTPDKGNLQKKRVPQDPKNSQKQLLFSQEIDAIWRERILELEALQQRVEALQEPIEQQPNLVIGEEAASVTSQPAPPNGGPEGATGQNSMEN